MWQETRISRIEKRLEKLELAERQRQERNGGPPNFKKVVGSETTGDGALRVICDECHLGFEPWVMTKRGDLQLCPDCVAKAPLVKFRPIDLAAPAPAEAEFHPEALKPDAAVVREIEGRTEPPQVPGPESTGGAS